MRIDVFAARRRTTVTTQGGVAHRARVGERRPRRRLLLGVSAAVGLLLVLVFAGPALAAETHAFEGSFGSQGSGAGQVSSPQGVAVNDSTGDVYVADTGNARVDEFDSSGNFIRAWGWGVADGITNAPQSCTLMCFAGITGSGAGQFTAPAFIAVDNSGGASAGDVYVGDTGDNLVTKSDANGNLVSSWGSGGQLNGGSATGGLFTAIAGITLDASGNLFVYDPNSESWFEFAQDGAADPTTVVGRGTDNVGIGVDTNGNLYKVVGNGNVEEFSPSGTDVGNVTSDLITGQITGFAIDPTNNDIYGDYGSEFDDGSEIRHYAGSGRSTCAPTNSCAAADTFGNGHLSNATGVAVDSATGMIYAADSGDQRVAIFAPATIPDVATSTPSNIQPTSVTLNGHVDPAGGGDVTSCQFEYGTEASYGQTVPCVPAPPYASPTDISADIAGLQPNTTYHFRLDAGDANGTNQGPDETFTTAGPPSIDGESSANVAKTSATLQAQINPDGLATTYQFEYGTTTAYGTSSPVPDGSISAGFGDQGVSVDIGSLQPATSYHWRVVATNSQSTVDGSDQTLTTMPAATIDSVSATDIAAESATLQAEINPLGDDTGYHFEYGPTTAYGASIPVPDADIGSGSSDVAVSQQITGLTANTTYHYRVVASNDAGASSSADHTFIYDTAGAGLPDGRAYEMVTPLDMNGALIGSGASPELVAADGNSVMVSNVQCFGDETGCTGVRENIGEPIAFSRTADGWVTEQLAPPASEFSVNTGFTYSPDAGTALFSVPGASGGADELLARESSGSFAVIGPVSPPSKGAVGPPEAMIGTSDLSHVVFSDEAKLFGWPFDSTAVSTRNIDTTYEYVGTGNQQPILVGVSGGAGSTDVISQCGTVPGVANNIVTPGVMSADGRTIFFTADGSDNLNGCPLGATAPPTDELYARIDESSTVLISGRSPAGCTTSACQSSPASDASFEGASQDGSKAFFTDPQQLTDDATQGSGTAQSGGCFRGADCNLYLYDFANPPGQNLIDVSAGDSSGTGPDVQGVAAISPDGSHVYFIAGGVLSGHANAQGQTPQAGADNLYLYERDAAYPAGRLSFVATLPASDSNNWNPVSGAVGNVTPDSRFFVFTSHGDLTGDDTSTSGAAQVFRYDAETGQLVRISVGELGFNDNGNAGGTSICGVPSGCAADASIVAGSAGSYELGGGRFDPTMSDDGSYVFFTSPVGLTPEALNLVVAAGTAGTGRTRYAQNVYEWHEGHVYLISDGKDTSAITNLLGTDATGANVFFTTFDQLVPQDTDQERNIYDARICTTASPCIKSPPPPALPCDGDTCQGTPGTPPAVLSAASVTFTGTGNLTPPPPAPPIKPLTRAQKLAKALKACHTKHGHKRTVCERQARKKYGPTKAKKARHTTTNRGAK